MASLPTELRPPLGADQAPLEADRCLECGGAHAPAPCALACPAGVDVPAFVAAIAAGEPDDAARTIFAANLLGGTCARVCPVEILCEGACVLAHEGRPPIAIGALQRHAADRALAAGIRLRDRATRNGRWVAVIGAGPAGLSCAGELAARGYRVTVYDEREEVGGLVRYAIAPYRQERDPLPAEAAMLQSLGVELHLRTPLEGPGVLRALVGAADAVFLGTGLGRDVLLELPGADLPEVWESLRFIEALKTGTPPAVGRRVLVVGGGNTAIDVARESLRLGAEHVTIVYRRTRAEMPAYGHEVDEAEEEGVRFQWLSAPVRFVGPRRLTGVECRLMTLGEPDGSGRRAPAPAPGSEFVLPADTAILAIGQRPRSELAHWLEGLAFEGGRLVVEPGGRTTHSKVFAGGDLVSGGASVVEAVRDGKRAADAIDEWLRCGD